MSADLVVLNKADLVDKDQLEALKAQIAGAVPRAVKIAPAREGAIGADVLLGHQRGGGGRSRSRALRIMTPKASTITTISTRSSSRFPQSAILTR